MKFLIYACAGLAVYAAYKFLSNQQKKAQQDLEKAEEKLRKSEVKQGKHLKQDPDTGVYRPQNGKDPE